MQESVQVVCENISKQIEVAMGTTLAELAEQLPTPEHPYLAAMVNNRTKELTYRIYAPITVRFVTIETFSGLRVYQHTAWFLLQKAVSDCYPNEQLHIRHSMGQSGFYCEIEGREHFTAAEIARLKARMEELVRADLPIHREKLPTEEVLKRYEALGYEDKIALIQTRPRLYSELYSLEDIVGYFYGPLTPSTRYITHFDLTPCYKGFYLALPLRTAPDQIYKKVRQEQLYGIFQEYQSWVEMMGFPTVGAVNARALAGDGGAMIKAAEAFHERKFVQTADAIFAAHHTQGARMVLISGPSSSGKTTSAKRLSIQLGVLGLRPVMISLDDYFVDREKTPRDPSGDYDYEALEAIDVALFNDHLQRLFRGEWVDVPRYDFITGRSAPSGHPIQLDERSILIVEGIHGLNPRLTPSIPDHQKFKVYISCFTSVAMDSLSRIATSDNRLLRRLVRDSWQRGTSALKTLARWESVRRGEERHIFPYQENADVMLNSSLFYEISVLRPFAEQLLREVGNTSPEYDEAQRMLRFLDNFTPIAPDEIPPTSVVREFIGGSSFTY